MEEYTPNSHKYKENQRKESKEENKKIEKAIAGTAKTRKKSSTQKFTDLFIPEDIGNVKSHIVNDVIIPKIKDIIYDTVGTFLFGGSLTNKKSPASKIQYGSYYNGSNNRKPVETNRPRGGYNFDDIILETRGDAEEVLFRMDEIIEQYRMVRVADLYELVGITGNYTDNKYGWTDIHSARIERVREGYLIKMPRACPLD